MENIDIRLRLIEERITNKEFLQSKKIAGEVPFYIFDYPPEYELKVRKYAKTLTEKIKKYYGISPTEFRKNSPEKFSKITQNVSKIGQKEVGEKVGTSESSMSKLKSEGRIEFFAVLTAVLGIKLSDKDDLMCSPVIAEAFKEILKNSAESPEFLQILFR